MERNYFLNLKTGTYHIKGYCKDAKVLPYNAIEFQNEEEVIAYGARSVKFCKNCAKHLNKVVNQVRGNVL